MLERDGASFPCVSSLGKIFLYLVVVLLGGALAAPLVWHLIHGIPSGWFGGFTGDIQRMPFHRYVSRSLQIAALLFLWPLLRSLRIRSLEEFGLSRNGHPLRDLGIGMLCGLFCGLLLEPVLLLSGAFTMRFGYPHLILFLLPKLILTAGAVAAIEEFLFRGVLLGFFRQAMPPLPAIIFSSLVFAAVHFLNIPPSGAGISEAPAWWSGLHQLSAIGGALPPWRILIWSLLTLFTAGVILSWLTIRTGSLWASIGLHGLFIFSQQALNVVSGYTALPQDKFLPLLGPPQCNGMVPVGLMPMVALLLTGCLAVLLFRRRRQPLLHEKIYGN